MTNKIKLQVYITENYKDIIKNYASDKGLSISSLMFIALTEYIDRHKITKETAN